MGPTIPTTLINRINAPVLAHVKNLSAHSDIAGLLLAAVKPLGDVQVFCPDALTYRYVVVATHGISFGFAVGMNTIAFRLEARIKPRDLKTGTVAYPIVARIGWPCCRWGARRLAGGGSAVLGFKSLCPRARNKTRRIGGNGFRQLPRLALTRRPARLWAMKLFLAIFVYLLIGAVLSWGILLALAGKPWLLVGSLIAYIVAFGKIGCTSH